jgi:hypothetical protein
MGLSQKLIALGLLVSIICNFYLYYELTKTKQNNINYSLTIDSLQTKIDYYQNKRDSIITEIDTVYLILTNTYKKYEDTKKVIINNNAIDDYKFFEDYLSRNKARYDSINNSSTIKNN